MRYEVATVPTETAGRLANLPTLTAATPNLGSPYFSNPTKKNIAPRVGFAFSPFADNKTVIHGAYGIYDALPLDYLFEGLTIFSAPFFQSGSITGGLNGTFPNQSYPLLTPLTFRYSYTPQHQPRSYVQQYTMNVQHQFAGDLVATVGYSGSHGTHLPYREDDINTVQPIAELAGQQYEFPALYSTTTYAKITNPKLNTNVGQISSMIPEGFLIYNSLQVGVTKRLSKRYQYQVSYTLAKATDDGSSSTFGDSFANSVSSLPYFARDRRIAVSDYNIKSNIVLNYLVLLPDVPQSFGRAGKGALNGWQYGGIFQASTGLPITPAYQWRSARPEQLRHLRLPQPQLCLQPCQQDQPCLCAGTAVSERSLLQLSGLHGRVQPDPRQLGAQFGHRARPAGLRYVTGKEHAFS